MRDWFEIHTRKFFFYKEDSEILDFIVIRDEVWRQDQTGIMQIQEQPVYKQILDRMCRDVPYDVPNPVVMVAGGEQGEQTVQGGQEHMYSLTGVSYCHCHKEGSGIAVPQTLITMLFLELGYQICQMFSQTQNMECIFHDLPPSPKCKAFILILLPSSFINFFTLGKQK